LANALTSIDNRNFDFIVPSLAGDSTLVRRSVLVNVAYDFAETVSNRIDYFALIFLRDEISEAFGFLLDKESERLSIVAARGL
jgi:hypothetical protein